MHVRGLLNIILTYPLGLGLNFNLSLYIHLLFVYMRNEDSGETELMPGSSQLLMIANVFKVTKSCVQTHLPYSLSRNLDLYKM